MGLDQTAHVKTENRKPKSERSLKPEIRSQIRVGHWRILHESPQKIIQNFVAYATKFCTPRFIVPMCMKKRKEAFQNPFTKTGRLQFFGIRHSDFLRISSFGFRISA